VLDLLTGFLGELGSAGESAAEFLSLYQSLVQPPPWKQYLAVRGVLLHLAELLTCEIQELHRLEDTTLTSDLAQGRLLFFRYNHCHCHNTALFLMSYLYSDIQEYFILKHTAAYVYKNSSDEEIYVRSIPFKLK
jgi:hypothetical protein